MSEPDEAKLAEFLDGHEPMFDSSGYMGACGCFDDSDHSDHSRHLASVIIAWLRAEGPDDE